VPLPLTLPRQFAALFARSRFLHLFESTLALAAHACVELLPVQKIEDSKSLLLGLASDREIRALVRAAPRANVVSAPAYWERLAAFLKAVHAAVLAKKVASNEVL
jgi:hypothetical protein